MDVDVVSVAVVIPKERGDQDHHHDAGNDRIKMGHTFGVLEPFHFSSFEMKWMPNRFTTTALSAVVATRSCRSLPNVIDHHSVHLNHATRLVALSQELVGSRQVLLN